MTPHEQSIQAATNAINRLGDLFGLMGDSDMGGELYDLYRVLIADLRGLDDVVAIRRRLDLFELDVYALVGEWINVAFEIGQELGKKNSDVFSLPPAFVLALNVQIIALAQDAIKVAIHEQANAALALFLNDDTGEYEAVLLPVVIARKAAQWLTAITNATSEAVLVESLRLAGLSLTDWRKQAIATIDGRTTATCLHVHGQVQRIDQPFILCCDPWESAKNYGFTAEFPPFHWWCRTVVIFIPATLANSSTTLALLAAALRLMSE